MNHFIKRLPKVLQNEIWEYVRGDRAHWKQQFNNTILKVIPYINTELHNEVAESRKWLGPNVVTVHFIGKVVRLDTWMDKPIVYVRESGYNGEGGFCRDKFFKPISDFEEAVKLFYEKVEFEAIRGPTTK